MWSLDVYAESALSPGLAYFLLVTTAIALVAGIVVGTARGRRRDVLARRAEASVGSGPPRLVEGGDVVLTGIVRHLEDHDVAVKVSVTQAGTESESSGTWSHSWIEIDREIVVAPFLLELPGGERVRVDPPRNVDVADALDQKVWIDRNKRVLSAELVPGEQISARGRLERSDVAAPSSAYRDVTWGWALTAVDGQMLLSSEPLGAGMHKRALFHRSFAVIAFGLLVASQISLVWFYGRAWGEPATATVTGKNYYTTSDSDGTYHHHVLQFERLRDVEVDSDDYESITKGDTLPFRRGSPTNWSLGSRPTLHWVHAVFLAALPIVFWGWYVVRRSTSRPWFRRKLRETGSGRLPDPP